MGRSEFLGIGLWLVFTLTFDLTNATNFQNNFVVSLTIKLFLLLFDNCTFATFISCHVNEFEDRGEPKELLHTGWSVLLSTRPAFCSNIYCHVKCLCHTLLSSWNLVPCFCPYDKRKSETMDKNNSFNP